MNNIPVNNTHETATAPQHLCCRDGVYYFVRRVPSDVQKHYRATRVSMSLRTKSRAAAARAARSVGQRLEDYWMGLRLKQMDVPALHLLIDNEADAKHDSPSMLEAVDTYLHLKASNDSPTFVRAAKRSGKYVVKALGNRPITAYSSADAAAFRDHLIESGLSMGSVKRIFGSVRSIINLVLREYGIEGSNAFSQTFMPDRNDTKDRVPIPIDKLDKLQHLCVQQNDDVRWLIALITDTGMRLSEAAGLAKTDINLNADIPYMFGSIKAIINLAMAEHGIEGRNPFASIHMPDEMPEERQPISLDDIRRIQYECKQVDDENRWLLALISDTGMRLSEAAGLAKDDIVLDADMPHIKLIPHPWRRMKTKGSERLVPLIGASLWAAGRLQQHDSIYAFPRYCDGKICNANSASAALNKWLKSRLTDHAVVHSLRHSMRDRLRAVECPSDIIDQIGGWSSSSVGSSYGKGYELPVLAKWMKMMEVKR